LNFKVCSFSWSFLFISLMGAASFQLGYPPICVMGPNVHCARRCSRAYRLVKRLDTYMHTRYEVRPSHHPFPKPLIIRWSRPQLEQVHHQSRTVRGRRGGKTESLEEELSVEGYCASRLVAWSRSNRPRSDAGGYSGRSPGDASAPSCGFAKG
jgi:hypothetical protein